VYVDRGAPTIAATGPLVDAAGAWTDPGEIAPKAHLAAHDDRSGIQRTELTATDQAGATVLDSVSQACAAAGPIGQPCPNDYANDVALNANALPEGTLAFAATATDHVGLTSAPQTWTLRLDRTPPVARAAGDLVALQDQWTNQTGPVATTLDGRDALSGVTRLDLVAVNDDGRRVIGSIDTCAGAADRDPTDGSCPHLASRMLTLNATDLPDGLNHFEVQAHDLAGHVSRPQDTWDTYIDHTPPPEPTGMVVTSNGTDSLAVHWNPVVDVPEGVAGVSYQYKVVDGGTASTEWTSTPYPTAIVPGLSPGVQYTIMVCATDRAKNLSKCTTRSGKTSDKKLADVCVQSIAPTIGAGLCPTAKPKPTATPKPAPKPSPEPDPLSQDPRKKTEAKYQCDEDFIDARTDKRSRPKAGESPQSWQKREDAARKQTEEECDSRKGSWVTVYRRIVGGRVTYVGITNNLPRRDKDHRRADPTLAGVNGTPLIVVPTRPVALAVEQALIVIYGFGETTRSIDWDNPLTKGRRNGFISNGLASLANRVNNFSPRKYPHLYFAANAIGSRLLQTVFGGGVGKPCRL